MRRHMLGMRRGGRDLCVTPGGIESLLGDRRIVVEVDQIVRDAGMQRLTLEDSLEDRRPLQLIGIGLVGGRCRDIQGQRIINLRLVIVRIALRQLLHRLQIGLYAGAMVDFVVIGVEDEEGVDVIALALRLCRKRLSFLKGGKAEREVGRGRRAVRIVQQAERDAPIGDGAVRIRLQDLLEDLLGRLVPERVLVAHRAVEPSLRRLVARCREMNRAEPLLGIVLAAGGMHEQGSGRCRNGHDRRE